MSGRIHSIETLATLDGPGLRTIVFMQGCPLKCKFCHNIDSTLSQGGNEYTVEELVAQVMKNESYWGNNPRGQSTTGGVTISGGEPTAQSAFLFEFISALKNARIHCTVDSCLYTSTNNIDKLAPLVDLWMVSIKEFDTEKHKELTGVDNKLIFDNISYLDTKISEDNLESMIRIRYVVIPGLTDSKELILKLGKFVSEIKNIEQLELLPYSSLGKHKWIEIFGQYDLEGVRDGTKADLERVIALLGDFNLNIKY